MFTLVMGSVEKKNTIAPQGPGFDGGSKDLFPGSRPRLFIAANAFEEGVRLMRQERETACLKKKPKQKRLILSLLASTRGLKATDAGH